MPHRIPASRMKQMNYLNTKSVAAAAAPNNRKKKAGTAKRRVLFVGERNTVREFESVDAENFELLESLWQQCWEMDNCKQEIKERAKKWRQTGMGVFLNDVFHCDNDMTPTLCQKQLNTLAQLPDELHMRGVERYLSRKHDQERTTRKRSTVREVVAQFRTLRTQVNANALGLAESQTILAQFARSLNQDAEVLARRMGKADEWVARKGPARSIRPAQELLDYCHDLELERMHKGSKSSLGHVKAAPHASAAITGRRLQARQA